MMTMTKRLKRERGRCVEENKDAVITRYNADDDDDQHFVGR